MTEPAIKTSQRVSRSCIECGRRKIRCDKKSPCQPCIRRNAAHECKRQIARVRGQLTVYAETDADTADDLRLDELLRERGSLQAQIAELETALALSKPCAHSRASVSTSYSQHSTTLEDLVPAFEQFDIGLTTDTIALAATEKDIADRLYEPAIDPIYLLLPSREASNELVTFSLKTLGWLHCAVNADTFLDEHTEFWQLTQLGVTLERERRPWLTVYLSVLAVGILYLEPTDLPATHHLPQLGALPTNSLDIAVHTSRIWYEAALKEIERYGLAGTPSLPVVQALSVLTLCNSNFGEHQREWHFTGFATNMARCLDMHKLGTETAFSHQLAQRSEWSTTSRRELGRRLWWACVIRDWLGSLSRPPSISPASFCCQFSTESDLDDSMPSGRTPHVAPVSPGSPILGTPSPAHYHSIMSRISYIVYIYIKANAHQTASKFSKAIEEIQKVKCSLPLHLSPSFPANDDDTQWELEHPWLPFQRYLLAYVFDFLQLSIARILVPKSLEDDTSEFRKLAIESANRLLHKYAAPVPRIYRLVWTVSAGTVAAAVYISLDILANSHEYRTDGLAKSINTLRQVSAELRKHATVAVHAAKGAAIIESILPLLDEVGSTTHASSYTLHDLLQQLSTASEGTNQLFSGSTTKFDNGAYVSNFEDFDMFEGIGNGLEGSLDLNEWNDMLLQI